MEGTNHGKNTRNQNDGTLVVGFLFNDSVLHNPVYLFLVLAALWRALAL